MWLLVWRYIFQMLYVHGELATIAHLQLNSLQQEQGARVGFIGNALEIAIAQMVKIVNQLRLIFPR